MIIVSGHCPGKLDMIKVKIDSHLTYNNVVSQCTSRSVKEISSALILLNTWILNADLT